MGVATGATVGVGVAVGAGAQARAMTNRVSRRGKITEGASFLGRMDASLVIALVVAISTNFRRAEDYRRLSGYMFAPHLYSVNR